MLLMLILLLPLKILIWSEKPYLYPTDLTSKRSGDLNQKNPTDSLQALVPSIYICDADTQRSNVAAASSTAIIINTLSLRFKGHFPDGSGLAGTRTSPFWILLDDGGGEW